MLLISEENQLLGVGHRNRKTAPIRSNVTSESAIYTTRWLSAITSSCWESFREEGLFRLICLAHVILNNYFTCKLDGWIILMEECSEWLRFCHSDRKRRVADLVIVDEERLST